MDMHRDGYLPIHRACWGKEKRHAATVKVFINAGVPYNVKSKNGQTCMAQTKNQYTASILKQQIFAEDNIVEGEAEEEEETISSSTKEEEQQQQKKEEEKKEEEHTSTKQSNDQHSEL